MKQGDYSLHVVCQWVHSKVALYRQHMVDAETSIQEVEDDLRACEQKYWELRRPFVTRLQ